MIGKSIDPAIDIACPGCGSVQHLRAARVGERATCSICATPLRRTRGTDGRLAAAVALATLIVLIPANLLPLYRVELLSGSRASVVPSGVRLFWTEGWALPALAMLVAVTILPLLRFALLSTVLLCLRTERRPRWLGPAFRVAETLAVWAMPEVMLLGIVVAYGRLHALFALHIGAGAALIAAASVGSVLTRALVDRRATWSAITPDRPAPAGPVIGCEACHLVLPAADAGGDCPRCKARLEPRKTNSIGWTTALIAAAALLYLPANLLPMALTIQFGSPSTYTVLQGVIDLARAHLIGLALLVFCASFLIPLLKLAGMSWLLWSVHSGSTRHLRAKTRLHRIVHEIGRWSMVDVLAIGTFAPLMQFDQLANAQAMPGMVAFLGVVVTTMFSTHSFDPRLLWDAGSRRPARREEFA